MCWSQFLPPSNSQFSLFAVRKCLPLRPGDWALAAWGWVASAWARWQLVWGNRSGPSQRSAPSTSGEQWRKWDSNPKQERLNKLFFSWTCYKVLKVWETVANISCLSVTRLKAFFKFFQVQFPLKEKNWWWQWHLINLIAGEIPLRSVQSSTRQFNTKSFMREMLNCNRTSDNTLR